jgi:hypothetical protein
MRPNGQGFLNDLATLMALLGGEAWVNSDHLMTSVCSFDFKDNEKGSPRSVDDARCQMMVLDHVGDLQVLNTDVLIGSSIALSYLKMEVASLTANLEMGFCHTANRFPAAFAPLLATAFDMFFTTQGSLRKAIDTRVLNRIVCLFQLTLGRKRSLLSILLLQHCQHGVVNASRFDEATHEQMLLFFIWIKSVLKRFHSPDYTFLGYLYQEQLFKKKIAIYLPYLKVEAVWLFIVE